MPITNPLGTYNINFVITDANGCQTTGSNQITVTQGNGYIPQTTVVNQQICQGTSFALPNGVQVTAPNTYFDFIPSQANPGCFDIQQTVLTVLPVPQATLGFEGCGPFCATMESADGALTNINWMDMAQQNTFALGGVACGLPNQVISVIYTGQNGCVGELFFDNAVSPLQILNNPITVSNLPYGGPDVLFSSADFDALIDGNDVVFLGSITIASDVQTLEISGATFRMGPGTEIILQAGAKVKFSDCTFMACDQTWKGLRPLALGNIQTGTSSKLTLENCLVMHAMEAIRAENETGSGQNAQLYRGPEVMVHLTTFRNNHRSVFTNRINQTAFAGETPMSKAFFQCTFEVDDEYFDHFVNPAMFPTMVIAFRQTGYGFEKCLFYNNIVNYPVGFPVQDWFVRGTGVWASESRFTVDGGYEPGVPDPNFRGFEFGIRAFRSALRVRENWFTQNLRGIFFDMSTSFRLVENWMDVGVPTGIAFLDVPGILPAYEGIVLNQSMGFMVTQNIVGGQYPGISDANQTSVGIRVRGSHTPDDEIYGNHLRNLVVGNLANGDNSIGSTSTTSGLRYVCNTNNQNFRDFLNSEFTSSNQEPFIANIQWDAPVFPNTGAAAGNTFSFLGSGATNGRHLRNEAPVAYTYRWGNAQDQFPSLTFNVTVPGVPYFVNTCAPLATGLILDDGSADATALTVLTLQESELHSDRQTAKYLYLSLLDEGDTEALQAEVDFTWSNDTWEMRERLLDISPFVSKTVLTDVANRTDVFPHPVALEIFIANPEVLRDSRFIDYLADKTDPMPEYMIDLLLLSADAQTLRTTVEENLETAVSAHQTILNQLIEAHANLENELEVRALLGRSESLVAEYLLIEMDLESGDYASASSRYADIPNRLRLTPEAADDHSRFEAWLDFYINHWNDTTQLCGLDSTAVEELRGMTDRFETHTGSLAMEVLNRCYGENLFIPPALGTDWSPRSAKTSALKSFENKVMVYPNPTDAWLTIDCSRVVQPGELSASVLFFELSGRPVHSETISGNNPVMTIDLRQWASGTYVYEVIIPSKPTEHGKVVVVH